MLAMKLLTAASAAPTDEIAYLSHSTLRVATTSAFEVARPSGVVSGDLLIAFYYHQNNSASLTLPSGWTVLRNAVLTDEVGVFAVCWRVAGPSEPTGYSFQSNNAGGQGVTIAAFTGGSATVSVLGANAVQNATASVSAPSITMTNSGLLLMFSAAENSGQSVVSGPVGMDQKLEAELNPRMTLYTQSRGAGSTGARTITWATTVGKTAVLLAIY